MDGNTSVTKVLSPSDDELRVSAGPTNVSGANGPQGIDKKRTRIGSLAWTMGLWTYKGRCKIHFGQENKSGYAA